MTIAFRDLTIPVDTPLIVIIGGGPAGLFCALQSAGAGRRVTVLEKNPSCGRKLLLTGSGQCNLTHEGGITEFFSHYGGHGRFLRPALLGYTNRDLVSFFECNGLSLAADSGKKIFPVTRKASDVLTVLLSECSRRRVEVVCRQPVRRISHDSGGFTIRTGAATYPADALVIATGGASYPATGSTGDGYSLARELGHTVTPIAPALTPVIVKDHPLRRLAGISFEGLALGLFRDGKKINQATGDLLITHDGLSGPGVLDLSRFILPGDTLKVSFVPGLSGEEVRRRVTDAIAASGRRQVKTILSTLPLPERFVRRLIELAGVPPALSCSQLPAPARKKIIDLLTGFPFPVLRPGGFEEAMVTRGGVTLGEIDPGTMESGIVPGLFFIGELLDIDGDTGGYNLQAAFSTGMLAARRIAVMFPDRTNLGGLDRPA
jgi:predicted Rossmann fold flavoprotein